MNLRMQNLSNLPRNTNAEYFMSLDRTSHFDDTENGACKKIFEMQFS